MFFNRWSRGLLIALSSSIALSVTALVAPVGAHETSKVGVLIVDHGEPVEFNEQTYDSFRMFLSDLIEVGSIPRAVLFTDTGTILQDRNCYACPTSSPSPALVDGWSRPFDGPASFVSATSRTPAHWLSKTGAGVGEPDFFEHSGHSIRLEWAAMGNRSPNYQQKLTKKEAVIKNLNARYGGTVAVRVGYHMNPRVNGTLGVAEAVRSLIQDEHVRHIVVGYHGVGFSDLMQTLMMRVEISAELAALGSRVGLSYAQPIGKSRLFIDAVIAKVRAELALVPAKAPVAIQLSGHGMSLSMCGTYNCAADGYHASSADLFARTKAAVERAVNRPGGLSVFRLYAEGADPTRDPQGQMDSPAEALAKRKAEGFTHVIDIPYEFDSDSRDTLIVLRKAYGLNPPNWNAAYETAFVRDGMNVKITNSSFGEWQKTRALEEMIRAPLDSFLAGPPAVSTQRRGGDPG